MAVAAPPQLSFKTVPFTLTSLKRAGADGGWEIAGYASTWSTTPDSYGDVVAPGCFAESIAERSTKFLYEHREPIGKQLEIREDARGLFGRWSIVPTRAGTDAHLLAEVRLALGCSRPAGWCKITGMTS